MRNSILEKLEERLGKGKVKTSVILAAFTTFKTGGEAEYYFEAQTEKELINAIKTAHELKLPLTIFGGASNVVIADEGLQGLVIRNQIMTKEVVEENEESVLLKVTSGYNMTRLAKETAEAGWEGLEYHLGLPGTVGGAMYMNSKWTNPVSYIGDSLVKAEVIDYAGNVKTVSRDYFQFGYDKSILQTSGEIVIWAEFRLKKNDPKILFERAYKSLEYRKQTQPFGVASSGCFFRNVDGQSAGKMIDELGLKGVSIGGAVISDKHANFIVNKGGATSADVRALIDLIKQKVKEKYKIDLQEEVIFL